MMRYINSHTTVCPKTFSGTFWAKSYLFTYLSPITAVTMDCLFLFTVYVMCVVFSNVT